MLLFMPALCHKACLCACLGQAPQGWWPFALLSYSCALSACQELVHAVSTMGAELCVRDKRRALEPANALPCKDSRAAAMRRLQAPAPACVPK